MKIEVNNPAAFDRIEDPEVIVSGITRLKNVLSELCQDKMPVKQREQALSTIDQLLTKFKSFLFDGAYNEILTLSDLTHYLYEDVLKEANTNNTNSGQKSFCPKDNSITIFVKLASELADSSRRVFVQENDIQLSAMLLKLLSNEFINKQSWMEASLASILSKFISHANLPEFDTKLLKQLWQRTIRLLKQKTESSAMHYTQIALHILQSARKTVLYLSGKELVMDLFAAITDAGNAPKSVSKAHMQCLLELYTFCIEVWGIQCRDRILSTTVAYAEFLSESLTMETNNENDVCWRFLDRFFQLAMPDCNPSALTFEPAYSVASQVLRSSVKNFLSMSVNRVGFLVPDDKLFLIGRVLVICELCPVGDRICLDQSLANRTILTQSTPAKRRKGVSIFESLINWDFEYSGRPLDPFQRPNIICSCLLILNSVVRCWSHRLGRIRKEQIVIGIWKQNSKISDAQRGYYCDLLCTLVDEDVFGTNTVHVKSELTLMGDCMQDPRVRIKAIWKYAVASSHIDDAFNASVKLIISLLKRFKEIIGSDTAIVDTLMSVSSQSCSSNSLDSLMFMLKFLKFDERISFPGIDEKSSGIAQWRLRCQLADWVIQNSLEDFSHFLYQLCLYHPVDMGKDECEKNRYQHEQIQDLVDRILIRLNDIWILRKRNTERVFLCNVILRFCRKLLSNAKRAPSLNSLYPLLISCSEWITATCSLALEERSGLLGGLDPSPAGYGVEITVAAREALMHRSIECPVLFARFGTRDFQIPPHCFLEYMDEVLRLLRCGTANPTLREEARSQLERFLTALDFLPDALLLIEKCGDVMGEHLRSAMIERARQIAEEDGESGKQIDHEAKSGKSEEPEDELDEDDIDLIRENWDLKANKRGRVIMSDSENEEDDRTAIKNELFGNAEFKDPEEPSRRERDNFELDYSDSEQSEDNFIVNEDGDRPRHRHHDRRGDGLNVPEGALDEARDIFGVEDFNLNNFYDEDEELVEDEDDEVMDEEGEEGAERVRRVRPKEIKTKATLLKTMEPSELERGYLAPADKKIQLEDRPERFQLRRTPVTGADELELESEARWIFKKAFCLGTSISRQHQAEITALRNAGSNADSLACEVIKEALKFIRNQLFEVPFIAFYRREHLRDMLHVNELWKIYDYDEKWCHLQTRKSKLIELMKRMQFYQIEGDSTPRRPINEADLHALAFADVYAHFQLYYGGDVAKMQEWEKLRQTDEEDMATMSTRFKQSSRSDKYQTCIDCGIGDMVARFGLTAKQFAENLDWRKHDVEQDPVPSLHAAEDHISTNFETPEAVIEAAIFMMAKEISREPQVRALIRGMYRTRAVYSCKPTKQGREQFETTSNLWNKRYVVCKPIADLENEEYLHYSMEKKSGNMEFTIMCDRPDDAERKNTLIDRIIDEGAFRKDEYSELVEDWNSIRERTVRMAIVDMMLPYFQQELEEELSKEAKMCVIQKCKAGLANRLKVAAYRPSEDEIEDDDEEFSRMGEVRVMAISYVNDFNEAAYGAVIDQDSHPIEYVRLLHLLKRGPPGSANLRQKEESMELFRQMVNKKRPHVIGIAGEDMEVLRLKRDLEDSLTTLLTKGVLSKKPPVVILNNEAAKIYMHSKSSLIEHPDYPPTLRQAISLARLLLDPLVEYCHLWNQDEDIFCLSFNPLQSEETLQLQLAQEMMNRVNECGVDVNRSLEHPHTASMLQFVSGLGPRKAAYLLKTIKQNNNLLESRTKLVTVCHMGPKVFMNCAGFIRIDTTKVAEKTDAYVEVLDGSRVHPETYEWARKMAVDALEVDENEEILQVPDRLKELKRQGFGEKKNTLYDISAELNCRYKDMREPFQPMAQQELFEYLTRDMKELREGSKVLACPISVQYRKLDNYEDRNRLPGEQTSSGLWPCTVCGAQFYRDVTDMWDHLSERDVKKGGCPGMPVGMRMRLPNGMFGFLPNKMISSKERIRNPLDRIKIGRDIYVKIMKLEPERFSALLSCKSDDLGAPDDSSKDNYWDYAAEKADQDAAALETEKKKQCNTSQMNTRVIHHDSFKNIGYREAERLLSNQESGDAIIRPSSNRHDHLTVTWKVCDQVCANIDVTEDMKEQPFTLGKRLLIDNEEYDDLDEILARCVQPMASYAREIQMNKYFLHGGIFGEHEPEIETRLRESKREIPSRIPYFFTPSFKYPGKFVISYIPRSSPRHEYMTVTPNGIKFRNIMFVSLSKLVDWFKNNYAVG